METRGNETIPLRRDAEKHSSQCRNLGWGNSSSEKTITGKPDSTTRASAMDSRAPFLFSSIRSPAACGTLRRCTRTEGQFARSSAFRSSRPATISANPRSVVRCIRHRWARGCRLLPAHPPLEQDRPFSLFQRMTFRAWQEFPPPMQRRPDVEILSPRPNWLPTVILLSLLRRVLLLLRRILRLRGISRLRRHILLLLRRSRIASRILNQIPVSVINGRTGRGYRRIRRAVRVTRTIRITIRISADSEVDPTTVRSAAVATPEAAVNESSAATGEATNGATAKMCAATGMPALRARLRRHVPSQYGAKCHKRTNHQYSRFSENTVKRLPHRRASFFTPKRVQPRGQLPIIETKGVARLHKRRIRVSTTTQAVDHRFM